MKTEKHYDEILKLMLKSSGGRLLDPDNICWKLVDGQMVGKRVVFTHSFRSCWLEDTKPSEVKSYSHGKDADYNETFYK